MVPPLAMPPERITKVIPLLILASVRKAPEPSSPVAPLRSFSPLLLASVPMNSMVPPLVTVVVPLSTLPDSTTAARRP